MEIGSLTGELALTDTLTSTLELGIEKVKHFGEEFDGLTGKILGGGALMVTALAGVAATVYGLTEHAAKAGEAVEAFSLKTGIAVQNVGPLEFAVKAAGGSLDQLNSMLMRMTMKEAGDSTGKFSAALADLGINATQFKQMDTEQKIFALGEGFRTGAIHGTNMADAMALMGRGGANMLPTLEKMTPELMAIAQQTAIIWTPETIEAAKQFSVNTNIVKESIENITTRIGAEMLPAMGALAEELARDPELLTAVMTATDMLSHALGYVVEVGGYVAAGLVAIAADSVYFVLKIGEAGVWMDKFVISILNGLSYIPGLGTTMKAAVDAMNVHLAAAQAGVEATNKTYQGLVTVGGAVYDVSQKIGGALLKVGEATDGVTEKTKNKAAADDSASAAAAKHEKAVESLYETLVGEGKAVGVIVDVFQRLSEEGLTYDKVIQESLLPQLDKLVKAHIALSPEMKAVYADTMANRQATVDEGAGLLFTNKIRLDYIETLKAHGLSEQNIATLQGVTIEGLKSYIKTIEDVKKAETDRNDSWRAGLLGLNAIEQESTQKHMDELSKRTSTIVKVEGELKDFQMKQALDTASYEVVKIWDVAYAEIAAFEKEHGANAEYSAAVILLASERADAAIAESDRATKKVIANTWAAYYAELDANMAKLGFTAGTVNPVLRTQDNSLPGYGTGRYQNGVDTWGTSAGFPTQTFGGTASPGATGPMQSTITPPQGTFFHYQEGGPVKATGPAMVHEGEYVVPRSGALVSGGGDTFIFNVTDTVQATRQFEQAIMEKQTQRRKFRAT